MLNPLSLAEAVSALKQGQVIAYPTEAVYGLGCDPFSSKAVNRLLDIKGREAARGVIVIAADTGQLDGLIRPVDAGQLDRAEATWPGPVTWLFPCADDCPDWLTGGRPTLAVRIPDHPVCQALCRAFGPLVSTSANPSGEAPALTVAMLDRYFGDAADLAGYVDGALGGRQRPSEIRDLLTGEIVRHG